MKRKQGLSAGIVQIIRDFDAKFIGYRKLKFVDLPVYSSWPKRLLGIEAFKQRAKTKTEVIREFEQEKWDTLLKAYKQRSWKTFKEFRDRADGPNVWTPCYWNEELFLIHAHKTSQLQADLISGTLGLFLPAQHIVELGCGYGAMLLDIAGRSQFKGSHFIGGELSSNGVKLINLMAGQFKRQVKGYEFDLENYDQNIIPQGAVIYTSFSLAYVSKMEKAIRGIIASKPKVVIHFEPVYTQEKNASLPSLMRRRYIEINDYGRDLVPVLKRMERNNKIEICVMTQPLWGINPFVPVSLIIWRPRS